MKAERVKKAWEAIKAIVVRGPIVGRQGGLLITELEEAIADLDKPIKKKRFGRK